MSTETEHLMVVDGQNDFIEGGTLAVPGGTAAMQAIGAFVRRKGRRLDVAHGTLDAHQWVHIAQPYFWENDNGEAPPFYTVITANDAKTGVWRPRHPDQRPGALAGKTRQQYAIYYLEALEKAGRHHTIWPPHCVIGTPGAAIQADLSDSLEYWAKRNLLTVNWVTKGANQFTEHFGGMAAEVPLHSDPSTGLNRQSLSDLREAGRIYFGGLALNICLRRTLEQIIANVNPELVKKFVLLMDGTAAIADLPGDDTPDWLESIQARGVVLAGTADI
jgi:nicotinamidase/pyrazinamidase